jgi:tRNA modification GTPase
MNKMDLAQNPDIPENFMPISLKDGAGINECLEAVTKMVEERYGYTDTPALTRERHREALIEAKAAMERALREDVLELSAENIRQSAVAIGRITGKIDVEQLLDVIFADFCIGK